jgi:hypothetical protein
MRKIVAVIVIILGIASCRNAPEHTAEFASQGEDTYTQYSVARQNWQSRSVANYQITVQVFSSILAPPCSSEFVLVVEEGEKVNVLETATAEAIQIQDNKMQNPQCANYERYTVSAMLNEIALLLDEPKVSQVIEVSFDQEYGYIESFHIHYENSEAVKDVVYSDFKVVASDASE